MNGKKGGRPTNDGSITITNKKIPRESKQHFIYLIYDTYEKEYKIGETQNLYKRRYDIKRPSRDLKVYDFALMSAYDAQQLERHIIKEFKDCRISGDWFNFTQENIKQVLKLFSEKTQVVTEKSEGLNEIPKKADIVIDNGIGIDIGIDIVIDKDNDIDNDKEEHLVGEPTKVINPIYIKMAEYMYNKILEMNPNNKKPNINKWADHFRKLVELDNREVEEIGNLINWVYEDSFWKAVILSPGKLREQYDQLVIKANRNIMTQESFDAKINRMTKEAMEMEMEF